MAKESDSLFREVKNILDHLFKPSRSRLVLFFCDRRIHCTSGSGLRGFGRIEGVLRLLEARSSQSLVKVTLFPC